jgi:hypothetical protein
LASQSRAAVSTNVSSTGCTFGGRAADDVEHLAGRGLVFERFFEVARARLQFAEQPRILHRNDRLRREVP